MNLHVFVILATELTDFITFKPLYIDVALNVKLDAIEHIRTGIRHLITWRRLIVSPKIEEAFHVSKSAKFSQIFILDFNNLL